MLSRAIGRQALAAIKTVSNKSAPFKSLAPTSSVFSHHWNTRQQSTLGSEALEKDIVVADPWFPDHGKSVKDLYEDLAATYEDYVDDPSCQMQSNGVMVDLMRKHWPCNNVGQSPTPVNVVDIGCGTGLIGKLFVKQTQGTFIQDSVSKSTFQGIDLTQPMVKKAQEFYSEALVGDVEAFPWPYQDNTADVMICNGVFIYLSNTRVLDEFVRVSKPGGKCILMFRHDALEGWQKKRDLLEATGKWKLIDKTPDMDNFPGFTESGLPPTWFNCFVYEVL